MDRKWIDAADSNLGLQLVGGARHILFKWSKHIRLKRKERPCHSQLPVTRRLVHVETTLTAKCESKMAGTTAIRRWVPACPARCAPSAPGRFQGMGGCTLCQQR
jgi:hypothetical protein